MPVVVNVILATQMSDETIEPIHDILRIQICNVLVDALRDVLQRTVLPSISQWNETVSMQCSVTL